MLKAGRLSEWQDLSRSSPETSPICSPGAQTAGQRAVNSSAAGVMEATVGVKGSGGGGEALCLLLSPGLFC